MLDIKSSFIFKRFADTERNSSVLKTKTMHEHVSAIYKQKMTEQTETQDRTMLIEELATLLSPDHEEDDPVVEWFQCHKNIKEKLLTSYKSDVLVSGSPQPLVPRLLHFLRDCLLTQQWYQALHVLTTVARVPVDSSYPVWKCGLELMQCKSGENNEDLVRNLYNQMKYLTDLNCHEVMLDYLLFFFKKMDMENAKETTQENVIRTGVRKKTDRDLYMTALLKAYSGLVWYVEWKQCQHNVELYKDTAEHDTGSLMMSSQSSTIFLEMQMNNYAQKALTCFQALKGQSGVWDIFIKKHVELLVYSERLDEALELLTDYRDINPENPNAMKYLYNFYLEHYPDSEQTSSLLKEIVKRLPADQLVLDYCERSMEGNLESVLPPLFKLLDYPCWHTDVRPWKMLAHCLEKCLHRSSDKGQISDVVKVCWDPRRSWWPQYHFTKYQIVKQSTKFDINYYKAIVAGLLCGAGDETVREIQHYLHEDEQVQLGNIMKHCHTGVT